MQDHDDWDPDITGDPMLDQFGYESPKQPPYHPVRWDAVAQLRQQQEPERDEWRRQREARLARQEAARARRRERRAQRQEPPSASRVQSSRRAAWSAPAPAVSQGPLPGQHGAYFEVRTKRVWWAPWRKRKVWQQVSTWHMGGPPAGAEVVTVGDVGELPGRVHTIGTVGQTGAVEW
jgi:hypothetical protein